jgi:hypothetical protein
MEIAEIKVFCSKKGISLSKFVVTRKKAATYLLKAKAIRDSIATVRTYDRIGKELKVD